MGWLFHKKKTPEEWRQEADNKLQESIEKSKQAAEAYARALGQMKEVNKLQAEADSLKREAEMCMSRAQETANAK